MVARLLWEQDVAGSNPVTSIILLALNTYDMIKSAFATLSPPHHGYGAESLVAVQQNCQGQWLSLTATSIEQCGIQATIKVL